MELKDYLEPFSDVSLASGNYETGFLGNSLSEQKSNTAQVALIGLCNTINSSKKEYIFEPNSIRKYLYNLSSINNIQVYDAGNLKNGKKTVDTYVAIKEVTALFMQKGIIPVFFGGSQEHTLYIAQGACELLNQIEVTAIDALVDYKSDGDFHSQSYLNNEFFSSKKVVSKSILAYQSYFTPQNQVRALTEKGYNFYRLGAVRNNFNEIEPILRDTHLLSFDLSSVRQSDSPNSIFKSPNGLYAEEACQLANIAGLSDKLKAVYIGEIDTADDLDGQSSHLMAQLIWHLLQGLSNRKGDFPLKPLTSYKKIYVSSDKIGHDLIFYQSESNKRFWIQLPGLNENEVEIIACSESDYKAVCLNEIPERIWKRVSHSMK